MTSLELAKEAVQILDKKKGMDLKLIGIRDISVLADYFVIATGTSSTHVKALADEVEFQLKEQAFDCNGAHRGLPFQFLDSIRLRQCDCTCLYGGIPRSSTIWTACGRTAKPWTSQKS